MATRSIELGGDIQFAGGAYPAPYTNIVSGAVRDHFVAVFPDGADTQVKLRFMVPKDFVAGNVTLKLYWTSETTTGNIYWQAITREATPGSTLMDTDTSPASQTDSVTTASKPGAAGQLEVDSITIDGSGWAVDDLVVLELSREASTQAGDTKADNVTLHAVVLEYSDA